MTVSTRTLKRVLTCLDMSISARQRPRHGTRRAFGSRPRALVRELADRRADRPPLAARLDRARQLALDPPVHALAGVQGHRPRRRRQRDVVDRRDRHDHAHRRGDERLLGARDVVERARLLARVALLDHVRTRDRGEDAVLQRRRAAAGRRRPRRTTTSGPPARGRAG